MDATFRALVAGGISFVAIPFLILLISILVRLLRRRLSPTLPISASPSPRLSRLFSLSLACDDGGVSFDSTITAFSLSVLAEATGNFSPAAIIGEGSSGFVYKAILPSGLSVAVKRLFSPDGIATAHSQREFRAEMETIGRFRHPNLARLLGYCCSRPHFLLLVYKFAECGCLDTCLHDPEKSRSDLTLPIRIRIAHGVAAGLDFLHRVCEPAIIHRDIKAGNVLLDQEFEPQIADFGLARFLNASRSHVSTQTAGTMGYMPPEYKEGVSMATTHGDVYSYGVLLSELMTRRRPSWPVKEDDGNEASLVKWARRRVEAGRMEEVLDKQLTTACSTTTTTTTGHMQAAEGLLKVFYKCTEECPRKRPAMREVLLLLDQLVLMHLV